MENIIISPKDLDFNFSEEFLDGLEIEIDESKIERIIMLAPEEEEALTSEEKMELVKKVLNYDVSEPIKNLFDDVLNFVSKM